MRRGRIRIAAARALALPLLALLPLPLAAAADWPAAEQKFKDAYRDGAPLARRRTALLELAASDMPEAADLLFTVWERLEEDTARLRRDLHELRGKARAMRVRARTEPDEVDPDALRALEARETEMNGRLGGLELERAAILAGMRGWKAAATLEWLAGRGLARARSAALL
ncbi:MAG: hypothetical protein L6Q95_00555, partial [Planctomycetes bacterium]|nr:hypothetical protein [Planctomycetota bacterium]